MSGWLGSVLHLALPGLPQDPCHADFAPGDFRADQHVRHRLRLPRCLGPVPPRPRRSAEALPCVWIGWARHRPWIAQPPKELRSPAPARRQPGWAPAHDTTTSTGVSPPPTGNPEGTSKAKEHRPQPLHRRPQPPKGLRSSAHQPRVQALAIRGSTTRLADASQDEPAPPAPVPAGSQMHVSPTRCSRTQRTPDPPVRCATPGPLPARSPPRKAHSWTGRRPGSSTRRRNDPREGTAERTRDRGLRSSIETAPSWAPWEPAPSRVPVHARRPRSTG